MDKVETDRTFMGTDDKQKPSKALILCWDDLIKEHREINTKLLNMLDSEFDLTIINYPIYLESLQLIAKQNTEYSETNALKRVNDKLENLRNEAQNNKLIRRIAGKREQDLNSLSKDWPKSRNQKTGIFSKGIGKIMKKIMQGTKAQRHTTIDLSLFAKIQIDQLVDIKQSIISRKIEKNLERHYKQVAKKIARAINNDDPSNWIIFNCTVYGLDWACRDIAKAIGCEHRFIETSPLSRDDELRIRIYTTYPDDLRIRREAQENIIINQRLADEAISYAHFYLKHRLSGNTSHTFSPINGTLKPFSKILSELADKDGGIWSYFSNSPDELACIEHAISESKSEDIFITKNAGVAQDEEEAIRLLAKIAEEKNALLVVRLHPRLGTKDRSGRNSSALASMLATCEKAKKLSNGHVEIIGPNDQINSYLLALLSDKVVSFRGTMPVESNLLGIEPVVLAFKKGFSNFWIRSHAIKTPVDVNQLKELLDNTTKTTAESSLIRFLVEFWMINRLGDLPLRHKEQWHKIHQMISDSEIFYKSELSKWVESDIEVKNEKISEMEERYKRETMEIVETIFFGGV